MLCHPYYKKAIKQLRKEQSLHFTPEVHMFEGQPEDFPTLAFTDPSTTTKHSWKVPQPSTVDSEGRCRENTAVEQVLN